jgi:hypothetical protein
MTNYFIIFSEKTLLRKLTLEIYYKNYIEKLLIYLKESFVNVDWSFEPPRKIFLENVDLVKAKVLQVRGEVVRHQPHASVVPLEPLCQVFFLGVTGPLVRL